LGTPTRMVFSPGSGFALLMHFSWEDFALS
jgi:hypothetical protein